MRRPSILGLAALILALSIGPMAPAQAQSGGSGSLANWVTWRADNPFRNHPMAHSLGGVGMDLFARGPWIARSWRDRPWKRLAWVAVIGAAWQFQNLKEIQGYSTTYAALDLGTNLLAASLVELIF